MGCNPTAALEWAPDQESGEAGNDLALKEKPGPNLVLFACCALTFSLLGHGATRL